MFHILELNTDAARSRCLTFNDMPNDIELMLVQQKLVCSNDIVGEVI